MQLSTDEKYGRLQCEYGRLPLAFSSALLLLNSLIHIGYACTNFTPATLNFSDIFGRGTKKCENDSIKTFFVNHHSNPVEIRIRPTEKRAITFDTWRYTCSGSQIPWNKVGIDYLGTEGLCRELQKDLFGAGCRCTSRVFLTVSMNSV